ncbi:RBM40 protein, partial [Polypterus senegalus]
MNLAGHQDRDQFNFRKSKTLIIRHLPSELTRNEKEDLLKYFGALSVRVFSDKGRMALGRLHQMKILNHTLVVEFAKDQDSIHLSNQPAISDTSKDKITDSKGKPEAASPVIPLVETGVAPSLGLKFLPNPCLKYLYPPPTNVILANVANAMASVPKFYVQFEDFVPTPPISAPPENPPLPEEEMEFSSEAESEYISEDDEEHERMVKLMGIAKLPPKRQQKKKSSTSRKKPKLKDLLYVPKPDSQSNSHSLLQPSDVFEQLPTPSQKKIEFHISSHIPGMPEVQHLQEVKEIEKKEEVNVVEEDNTGFGKIYPSLVTEDTNDSEHDSDSDIPSEFISRRDLEKGRISKEEMKKMSLFKHYEPGDPTCRLYIKNVAKQVEEKHLKFIFGRYVDFTLEAERNMFDIVLMKEGRMKGQAFVGLPSEKAAAKALKEVHGYVLYDKPMIIVSF